MTTPDFPPPVHRQRPSRRQVLTILAGSAAIPLGVAALRMWGPQPVFHYWYGEALGAEASMQLWHSNAGHAKRTLARMVSEVLRLEAVFSLYRPDSEISRLNRDGALADASRDMTNVLERARALADVSGGAFDPSVQPLWTLYENHFRHTADPEGPPPGPLAAARRVVDYRKIDLTGRKVRLASPRMGVTLNGIAQGYVTDVVADLLRNEGFDHVVVELGETRVLGPHPDGRPWRVGLKDSQGGTGRSIDLVDQSSATSGGYGTVFDPAGKNHHIFDPATGLSANSLAEVVVIAPRAMDADALATAIFVAGEDRAPALLALAPAARAMLTRKDGTVVNI
ncbi:FAD:protein FMN transferase [Pontivivens nitratireducens]|uniref:FAD:protein FMN transferase n=1 Tax=Pontivivens nitratireducens TaxID=2758038 RepID=A0A6G7VJG3_9RHOB|nr:FAD:protein FMN transferase [Pontibrevibacter nitratireducens]QIK39937.1 FAD:protein FMN transferase [Pontibrevibacter nitratireducens]